MKLKVSISPLVDCYLLNRYPSGIKYSLSDNLTLIIHSLIQIPKAGQINKRRSDGITLILSDQFVNDNRTYFPEDRTLQLNTIIKNEMYKEVFHELEKLVQQFPDARYKGINSIIEMFLLKYELTNHLKLDTVKKAFYRHRIKKEKISGSFLPSRPFEFNQQRR